MTVIMFVTHVSFSHLKQTKLFKPLFVIISKRNKDLNKIVETLNYIVYVEELTSWFIIYSFYFFLFLFYLFSHFGEG